MRWGIGLLCVLAAGCSVLVSSGDDGPSPNNVPTSSCGEVSLQFSEGDFVEIPANLDVFGLDDFTVSMWVRPDTVSGKVTFVSNEDESLGVGWSLYVQDSTLTGQVQTEDTRCRVGDFGGQGMAEGVWQHVALTLKDGTTYLQLDGGIVDTNPCSAAFKPFDGPVAIGRDATTDAGTFRGQLDDLVVCTPGLAADIPDVFAVPVCMDTGATPVSAHLFEEGGDAQRSSDSADPAEERDAVLGSLDSIDNGDPSWVAGDECE